MKKIHGSNLKRGMIVYDVNSKEPFATILKFEYEKNGIQHFSYVGGNNSYKNSYKPDGTVDFDRNTDWWVTKKEWKKLKQMKKEIIGYRLVKPEYYKTASIIMFDNDAGSFRLDDYLPINYHALHKLRAAGVLDLWFEPVYKEKEFEFGRWYNGTSGRLYFITGKCTGYGFDSSGNWVNYGDDGIAFGLHMFTPATDTEVKERLLAYAREKYPIGTKVKSVYSGGEYCTDSDPKFYYSKTYKQAIDGGFPILYGDGKWAEIISEPEKETEIEKVVCLLTEATARLENLM